VCAAAWLLPVLEEGLGSNFYYVFGHFSSSLALFSRSTLGDLHAAGWFQLFGRKGCSQQSYNWILGRERR